MVVVDDKIPTIERPKYLTLLLRLSKNPNFVLCNYLILLHTKFTKMVDLDFFDSLSSSIQPSVEILRAFFDNEIQKTDKITNLHYFCKKLNPPPYIVSKGSLLPNERRAP